MRGHRPQDGGLRAGALAALLGAALCSALGAAGCGGADAALRLRGQGHDVPVPENELRAEIHLLVDLVPAQGCEERFDLALYKDRGVDLIAWDERAGACAGRTVTIRYLPRRTSEAKVLAAVHENAARVAQLPPQAKDRR